LVPKSLITYGWDTPASRATASVEVPVNPVRANDLVAAARISWRRASALILELTAWRLMACYLPVNSRQASSDGTPSNRADFSLVSPLCGPVSSGTSGISTANRPPR